MIRPALPLLLALCLLRALPAAAAETSETVVTATEFERLSTGKTLYFGRDGERFGIEQFHGNRLSTWQYADGTCAEGRWFSQGDAICFVYDTAPEPQCWLFAHRGGDYFARLRGRPAGDPTELRLIGIDTNPVPCPGPDLGV